MSIAGLGARLGARAAKGLSGLPVRLGQVAETLPGLFERTLKQSRAQAEAGRALHEALPKMPRDRMFHTLRSIVKGEPFGIEPTIEEVTGVGMKAIRGIVPIKEGAAPFDLLTAWDSAHGFGAVAGHVVSGSLLNEAVKITRNMDEAKELLRMTMLAGDNPAKYMRGLHPAHQDYVRRVRAMYDKFGATLQEEGLLVHLLEDYMPRVYKNKDGSAMTKTQALELASKHAQRRKFPTLDDAAKDGYVLVNERADFAAGQYVRSVSAVTANRRMLDAAHGMKMPDSGLPMLAPPEWARKMHLTDDYEYIQSSLLDSYLPLQRMPDGTWSRSTQPMRLMVHKDAARPMKVMLEDPLSNKAIKAALLVNAILKRTTTSFAMFHAWALSEGNVAIAGGRGLFGVGGRTELGHRLLATADDVIEVGIRNGLTNESLSDADNDIIQRGLARALELVKDMPLVHGFVNKIKQGDLIFSRSLWDYYNRGGKIASFAEMYHALLLRQSRGQIAANLTADQLAASAARAVNEGYGGLNWNRLMVTPNMRNLLRLAAFAPDWTTSNLKIAFTAALNTGLEGDLARQYALRAGIAFGATVSLANMMFSGHWPWENEEGRRDQIQLPYTDERGRAKYLQIGKQFMEPLDWLRDTGKTLYGKVGILPKGGIALLYGRDYFGHRIVDSEDGPFAAMADMVGYQVEAVLPIGAQNAAAAWKRGEITTAALGLMGLQVRSGRVKQEERPER